MTNTACTYYHMTSKYICISISDATKHFYKSPFNIIVKQTQFLIHRISTVFWASARNQSGSFGLGVFKSGLTYLRSWIVNSVCIIKMDRTMVWDNNLLKINECNYFLVIKNTNFGRKVQDHNIEDNIWFQVLITIHTNILYTETVLRGSLLK